MVSLKWNQQTSLLSSWIWVSFCIKAADAPPAPPAGRVACWAGRLGPCAPPPLEAPPPSLVGPAPGFAAFATLDAEVLLAVQENNKVLIVSPGFLWGLHLKTTFLIQNGSGSKRNLVCCFALQWLKTALWWHIDQMLHGPIKTLLQHIVSKALIPSQSSPS